MFAVVAPPSAEDRALVGRRFELRFGEHRRDRRAIFFLELARVGRDPLVDSGLLSFVDLEQLGHEAPAPIQALGHTSGALIGAVTEAYSPIACKLAMVGDLLHGLVRKVREKSVARLG